MTLTEILRKRIEEERERHRRHGCRLFDDKLAKCTCPALPEEPRV